MSDDESDDQDFLFPDDEFPKPDDAASARGIRKKQVRTRLQAKERARFWQSVLGTEIGRREVWGLLSAAGTFETPFACGPNGFPHPEATWFKAGQQEVGLRLFFSMQRIDAQAVFQMQQENDPRFARVKMPPKQADE